MDEVVPEPLGGAHTAPEASAVELLKQALLKELEQLLALSLKARLESSVTQISATSGRVMRKPSRPGLETRLKLPQKK